MALLLAFLMDCEWGARIRWGQLCPSFGTCVAPSYHIRTRTHAHTPHTLQQSTSGQQERAARKYARGESRRVGIAGRQRIQRAQSLCFPRQGRGNALHVHSGGSQPQIRLLFVPLEQHKAKTITCREGGRGGEREGGRERERENYYNGTRSCTGIYSFGCRLYLASTGRLCQLGM